MLDAVLGHDADAAAAVLAQADGATEDATTA